MHRWEHQPVSAFGQNLFGGTPVLASPQRDWIGSLEADAVIALSVGMVFGALRLLVRPTTSSSEPEVSIRSSKSSSSSPKAMVMALRCQAQALQTMRVREEAHVCMRCIFSSSEATLTCQKK